jgi:uncharacterized protein
VASPVGPFLVGVTELVRRHGTRRPTSVCGPLDELALSSAAVPVGADVCADLVLESIADGSITAIGTVRAPWVGECRRCLQDVTGELAIEVSEVFEANPIDGETYPLDHERLDLAPMVRDVVLLALPLAPLCSGGCAGPDPDAHPVTVAVDDGEAPEPPADPRWSGLADLKFD